MGKALYLKLDIKEDISLSVINPPEEFDALFKDVSFNLEWTPPIRGIQYIHFFPQNISDLEESLPNLQDIIDRDGMI